jgi:hypothetical protein
VVVLKVMPEMLAMVQTHRVEVAAGLQQLPLVLALVAMEQLVQSLDLV